MDLGSRITQIRKEKELSRNELGEKIGTSGAIIGRYERNEMVPSVEIATSIANILDVSLDYLVGNASLAVKDKKILERLETIEQMPPTEKQQIVNVIDALIRDSQAKKTYGFAK